MSEPSISGKGKGKENQGKSKGLSRGTKSENICAKGSCEGNTSEMGQVDTADTSWIHEEWSQDEKNEDWSLMSGMMTGVLLDGVKIANKHMTHL